MREVRAVYLCGKPFFETLCGGYLVERIHRTASSGVGRKTDEGE